ncbi:hypothetical protein [Aquicoccus porphyridii]|uniref:hypothetical protein n=1 Tax=Aquicoccus porphyridii TaxID=1852029 RepID=UPI00273D914A|nr:hypothetical protein [Aquicoccus porphyridii]
MERDTDWIRPVVILVLLAAPAIGVHIASHFSDDPHLQPLAISSERGASASGGRVESGLAMVEVDVDWGQDWAGRMSRVELRDAIARSLSSQTDLYRVRFREAPGARIGVSFRVGPNVFGPYPPGGMRDGIHSALVALDTTNRSKR